MAGKTKNYTDDFKKQIVALKQSGKSLQFRCNHLKMDRRPFFIKPEWYN